MVTGTVKKNETTQFELIELFGGPSVMTTDRDGTEVWMYDRTTSVSHDSYGSSDKRASRTDAGAMAGFFGLGIPTGAIGGGGTVHKEGSTTTSGQHSSSHSIRTITFIVKFNEDKTVKDYAVRQASY